jgi:hypothetical protein
MAAPTPAPEMGAEGGAAPAPATTDARVAAELARLREPYTRCRWCNEPLVAGREQASGFCSRWCALDFFGVTSEEDI